MKKFLSILLLVTLLVNPIGTTYAQETSQATPSKTLENTTEQAQPTTSSPITTDPSPTPSPTSPPPETTPSPTPSSSNQQVPPTATPTPTPAASPSVTPTPTQAPPPETSPSPTPSPSPMPTPEATPTPNGIPAATPINLQGDYTEGEVLIRFKEDKIDLNTTQGQLETHVFATQKGVTVEEKIEESNIVVVSTVPGESVSQTIGRLKHDPRVAHAQPNYIYRPLAISTNDTHRGLLWGLDNTGQTVNGVTGTADSDIDAPEAWTLSEGMGVVVAVIDSGVLYNHPDLATNMWDGTTCQDDNNTPIVGGCPNHGWDFAFDIGNPIDEDGHGTHIAGIIAAAKSNAEGVIGVAPSAKIMALRTDLFTDELVRAINFAKNNDAKIINASWGGSTNDQLLATAIQSFPGLFIAAAGNGGEDSVGDDNDGTPEYPCNFDLANIICVAATDQNDGLADFSNYGATTVDVGAPGVNIYSTYLGNGYAFLQGTSMATPHVTGLAALVWSNNPNLSVSEVKDKVVNTGDSVSSLSGKTATGKRINAYNALPTTFDESNANVVINEFVFNPSGGNDWVELYNRGSSDVDLSGWKLDDSTSTIKTLSGTLYTGGFLVFEVSNRLNAASPSGDTITLKDNQGNVVNQVSYKGATTIINDTQNVGEVEEGWSVGRGEDGNIGGNTIWEIFSDTTKGYNNSGDITFLNVGAIYPYEGISQGLNNIAEGGTINVAAGEYYESLSIEQQITLIGAGTGASTIFDNDCSGVIAIYANNVTVRNFTLDGDGCGESVLLLEEVDDVTIQGNEIINGYYGIELDETQAVQIRSNTIYNNEDFGVWLNNTTESLIEENEIYDNGYGGIRLNNGDFGGTAILENNIHNNQGDGIFGNSGITFSQLTISDNTIQNNTSNGIYFNGVSEGNLIISGNIITNNSSTGMYLSGRGNSVNNSTVTISNNTVSTNDGDGIYTDVITSSTFNLLNNTIEENDGNGIYICAEGECTNSTLTISRNSTSENNSSGLYLYNILASTVVIDNNEIMSNNETGIYIQYIGTTTPSDPSTVTLTNNTVSRNSSYGVYLNDVDDISEVEIGSGNTISTNSSSGIYLNSGVRGVLITGNTIENNSPESESTGIEVRSATGNEAHQNLISGNGTGINNQDEENFFDATENFWGHSSGPLQDALNPQGQGDSVGSRVWFSPFYVNENLDTLVVVELDTTDLSDFVENGIFDLPDDEEGQLLVEFLTISQEFDFEVPGVSDEEVTLPEGTRIERTDDEEFEWDDLAVSDISEDSLTGLGADLEAEGALQWGIPNVELEFNQPITIDISVNQNLNSKTLQVQRSTSGSGGWTANGIVAPGTCTVTSGLCTFQATKASFFAVTSTVPTPATPTTATPPSASVAQPLSAANPPSCSDTKPGSAPTLLSTTPTGLNQVTLTWSRAKDPVTYYLITYGLGPGLQQYGNPNVGGKDTTSYTIAGLSVGTYYFRVRAGNGCAPGDYSNEVAVTTQGRLLTAPAIGFQKDVLGTKETREGAGTPTLEKSSEQQPLPTKPKPSPKINQQLINLLNSVLGFFSGLFNLNF